MPKSYALLIADGRKSKYGINACLGALEDLDGEEYPDVLWAARDESLAALAHRVAPLYERLVVLWSLYSTEFVKACARLSDFKSATADLGVQVQHVAGGVHATAEPELTARSGFDFVAVGEGEETTRRIVHTLNGRGTLDTVEGLSFLDKGDFHASRAGQVESLDRYPTFAMRQGRLGPIELTRGCIYACRFCQTPFMFKARFRHRSIASVVEHVEWQVSRGLLDVRFITPTSLSYGATGPEIDLTAVETLLHSVREALPRGGRIFFGSFPSEIRPEHASVEALEIIRRYADNDNVILGAQSGSDRMLAASHRGHDAESVLTAVENCRKVGLKANVDFIFGMPGESKTDVGASIRLAEVIARMGARIHTHTFMPLPGTPWSHEPPGVVQEDMRELIQRLTADGLAYGNWEAQEVLAKELAAFDSYSNRRKSRRNHG